MLEEIEQAIKDKIIELFGEVTIYQEDLPEKYSVPCFLIRTKEGVWKRGIGRIKQSTYLFEIQYFSDREQKRSDCLKIGETFVKTFDVIGNQNHFVVHQKKLVITDDVLSLTFQIQFRELLEEEQVTMKQRLIMSQNLH